MHPKYREQPPANFQAAASFKNASGWKNNGCHMCVPYSYSFYTSSSKSKARAELNRSRSAVLRGLHAADRTERPIPEAADVIRRFRERRRVHPLIDAPVRGI